jgi:hypothetical protein
MTWMRLVPKDPLARAHAASPPVLAFTASNRVLGLSLLPLDGNPNRSAGVLAHAGPIAAAAVMPDGRRIVTAGGEDGTLAVWTIRRSVLVQATAAGGEGGTPFRDLLPGGSGGVFYQELCDLFAYAQIRAQGEESTQSRRAGDRVPVRMLPELMRALGYYPTEFEAAAMLSEVRALAAAESGAGLWADVLQQAPDAASHAAAAAADGGGAGGEGRAAKSSASTEEESVTLAAVVRLFVNHRPVLGVAKEAIAEAVRVLAAAKGRPGGKIPWKDLVAELRKRGEALTRKEIDACLHALVAPDQVPKPDALLDADTIIHSLLGFVPDQTS